ncbi:hypothetical protein [Pseudomonas costantinii]|uniref:Uncharacterized protein n=1 Tax=Pseudomonas costantinii TaxID=168469 RepID=A0A1S2V7J1_9PSED|nr:hypothetical protein [Pseudomonas costantinii]NVZ19703.1 hypothetical protein [Pseudomonas costantinii]OIN54380.1 hypothetical protein BFL40_06675 [Pseudomonas costantinii]SED68215.1 hypothetical protein SAMN04515675_2019 [Pseudomonas costantinii]
MLTLPLPRFQLQDSTRPTPNLDTGLIQTDSARVLLDFPVEAGDQVYLTISSTILGGEHNQSFFIALAAPSCVYLVPKSIIEISAGTTVTLLARLRRGVQISGAPSAAVNINRLPIIVVPPTPSTVWDFANGFQGWVAQGNYIGGLLHVIGGRVVADLLNSQAGKSHIISRTVLVTAGRTYDFSFDVTGRNPADGSTLFLTINGSRIGANVQNITSTQQTGTGVFTATTTGNVTLGIFNDAVPQGGHYVSLGNIRMTQRP